MHKIAFNKYVFLASQNTWCDFRWLVCNFFNFQYEDRLYF